jgi:hypothetical protein
MEGLVSDPLEEMGAGRAATVATGVAEGLAGEAALAGTGGALSVSGMASDATEDAMAWRSVVPPAATKATELPIRMRNTQR